MSIKLKTTEQFINEAKLIHGDKYDYSNVEYKGQDVPVIFICPIHGRFLQKPKVHLRGNGCPECGRLESAKKRKGCKIKISSTNKSNKKKQTEKVKYVPVSVPKTLEEFIKKAREIHGDKYDYSNVEYGKAKEKITIICHEHGEFSQTPYSHLKGAGCPICARLITSKKQKYTKDDFIYFANKKWGEGRFDYSQIEYIDMRTPVWIICHEIDPLTGEEHGGFWQIPINHLRNNGCKKCSSLEKRKKYAMTKEEFIQRVNKIHHGRYTYENVVYINNSIKVAITCPEHGDFMCSPSNHLKFRGCPICKAEKFVYEERLYNFLKTFIDEKDIERQKKFEWLSDNKSLDFYLPKYNIAIEHQGSQHFQYEKFLTNNKPSKFKRTIELDRDKFNECKENNVKLLYFCYQPCKIPIEYFDKIYTKEEEFKEKIISLLKY